MSKRLRRENSFVHTWRHQDKLHQVALTDIHFLPYNEANLNISGCPYRSPIDKQIGRLLHQVFQSILECRSIPKSTNRSFFCKIFEALYYIPWHNHHPKNMPLIEYHNWRQHKDHQRHLWSIKARVKSKEMLSPSCLLEFEYQNDEITTGLW